MNQVSVKHCVVINQPVHEIFAYMSNLENLVDWSSVVISVRKGISQARYVGTTAKSTIRFLGKWQDITFEIVESEPNRSLTIKSISGMTPCLFCYQFETGADGNTSVSLDAQIDFIEGGSDQAEPVIISAVRRQLEYDLLTLKDMLEAESSTHSNTN